MNLQFDHFSHESKHRWFHPPGSYRSHHPSDPHFPGGLDLGRRSIRFLACLKQCGVVRKDGGWEMCLEQPHHHHHHHHPMTRNIK